MEPLRGCALVMPQHSSEPRPTLDRNAVWRITIRFRPFPGERNVAQRLMRTLGVVVLDVLCNQIVEVLLAEHDEVIQRFLLQALNEPFDVGLQVRRTDAVLLHFDARRVKKLTPFGAMSRRMLTSDSEFEPCPERSGAYRERLELLQSVVVSQLPTCRRARHRSKRVWHGEVEHRIKPGRKSALQSSAFRLGMLSPAKPQSESRELLLD